jgi:hypothetical protein
MRVLSYAFDEGWRIYQMAFWMFLKAKGHVNDKNLLQLSL